MLSRNNNIKAMIIWNLQTINIKKNLLLSERNLIFLKNMNLVYSTCNPLLHWKKYIVTVSVTLVTDKKNVVIIYVTMLLRNNNTM